VCRINSDRDGKAAVKKMRQMSAALHHLKAFCPAVQIKWCIYSPE